MTGGTLDNIVADIFILRMQHFTNETE